MILFALLGLMTAVALAAVLIPLARRPAVSGDGGSDLPVYRDQLAEVDRDFARGVIGHDEAEAARVEISRRLLAASDRGGRQGPGRTPIRPVFAAIAVVVPLVALGFYLTLGNPALEGQPLAARQSEQPGDSRMAELVRRVEAHLRENPEDGRGWEVIAPVYASFGRLSESAAAYRTAIRLNGEKPVLLADLGEVLTRIGGGVITAEARQAFEAAAAAAAPSPKARFFLAIAAEQEGDFASARDRWMALLADAPPQAPWRGEVEARLSRARAALGEAPSGPTSADVEAAGAMSPDDRMQMIEGMIDQLDRRLADEGGTSEEWVRLIRSYMVLDRSADAEAALDRARAAKADDPAALADINAAAGSFGLGG